MSEDEQLDILREQIRNFENDKRKVSPDVVKNMYDKALKDRSVNDYQQIQKLLWNCNLFATIRNAKVISDNSILELIKQLRFQQIKGEGSQIYAYGSSAAPHGSTNISDMEAFIVIKGRIGIKAPRLVQNVTLQTLIDRYEDVLWEKSSNGDIVREKVDNIIRNRKEVPQEVQDMWMFDQIKEVGPTQIFGEVVLIQPKPRTTTAICLDDYTELLCLSHDTYTRIIEKAIKKDLYVRTHFLQQFRIFQHMTQGQLEKLLFFLTPIELTYDQVLYKIGDQPTGIYLIQNGSFEVTMPSNIMQTAAKVTDQYMGIDAGVKHLIMKKASVQQDRSMGLVSLAIIEKGEVLGLEECQVKPSVGPLPLRKHTITCKTNKSTVLFLSYQNFADRVLSDAQTERDIIFENMVKQLFFQTRQKQRERTLWNARHGREASFAIDGTFGQEEVKRPKLQTATEYIKQKINTEYYNLIISGLHERELLNLQLSDEQQVQQIEVKNNQIYDFFNKEMGVKTSTFKQQNPKESTYSPMNKNLTDSLQVQSTTFQNSISLGKGSKTIRNSYQKNNKLNLLETHDNTLFEDLHMTHGSFTMPHTQRNAAVHVPPIKTQEDSLYVRSIQQDIESHQVSIAEVPDQHTNGKSINTQIIPDLNEQSITKVQSNEIKQLQQSPTPIAQNKLVDKASKLSSTQKLGNQDLYKQQVMNVIAVTKQEKAQLQAEEFASDTQSKDDSGRKQYKRSIHPTMPIIHLPSIRPTIDSRDEQRVIQNESPIMNKSFQLRSKQLHSNKGRVEKNNRMLRLDQNQNEGSDTLFENPQVSITKSQMSREDRFRQGKQQKNSTTFPEIAFSGEQDQNQSVKKYSMRQSGLAENSVIVNESTGVAEPQQSNQNRNQFAPTVINIRANTNRAKKNSKIRRNNSMSSISPDTSRIKPNHYILKQQYNKELGSMRDSDLPNEVSLDQEDAQFDQMVKRGQTNLQSPANQENDSTDQFQIANSKSSDVVYLSPAAAAAATELIQNFLLSPNQATSAQEFLMIQQKYNLDPKEAYQLLVQQINFQKVFQQPATAATVVKMSHETYQSHVKAKRAEVITFRNELIQRFTNPLAKLKAKERELKKLRQLKDPNQSKSSIPELSHHGLKSKSQIEEYPI